MSDLRGPHRGTFKTGGVAVEPVQDDFCWPAQTGEVVREVGEAVWEGEEGVERRFFTPFEFGFTSHHTLEGVRV